MSGLGKEIFRQYDEYGPLIVYDDGNKRYLSFGEDDEQSCQSKAEPFLLQHDYTQAMLLVLLLVEPANIILLGLGGGCIAAALHEFLPALKLRVIELRPNVVRAAYKYFQFPSSKRMRVMEMDAAEFLEQTSHKKTDILFSDLFSAEGLDLQQTTPWFIQRCHALLKDDGWLVMNCWKQHRAEKIMIEALKLYFAEVRVCATVEGNWIIFAGKKVCTRSENELKAAAKDWSKILGYSLASSLSRLKKI